MQSFDPICISIWGISDKRYQLDLEQVRILPLHHRSYDRWKCKNAHYRIHAVEGKARLQ